MSVIEMNSVLAESCTFEATRQLARRLVCDETGQDVIEYGLLSSGIALVGILIWNNIGVGIATAYGNWDSNVQNLWVPNDPIGGGS